MPKLYVVYDAEGTSDKLIYGVFEFLNLAERACELKAKEWVDEILADDPEVTGLGPSDRSWLERECRSTLAIQEIKELNKLFDF